MEFPIDIHHFLPHQKPMLMVDNVLDFGENSVVTSFKIKEGNIFLQDKVFSESGLIENAAQTCSSIVGKDFYIGIDSQHRTHVLLSGFISSIRNITIYILPSVEDIIETVGALISKYVAEDYTLCTIAFRTTRGETLLMDGDINLYIKEER